MEAFHGAGEIDPRRKHIALSSAMSVLKPPLESSPLFDMFRGWIDDIDEQRECAGHDDPDHNHGKLRQPPFGAADTAGKAEEKSMQGPSRLRKHLRAKMNFPLKPGWRSRPGCVIFGVAVNIRQASRAVSNYPMPWCCMVDTELRDVGSAGCMTLSRRRFIAGAGAGRHGSRPCPAG